MTEESLKREREALKTQAASRRRKRRTRQKQALKGICALLCLCALSGVCLATFGLSQEGRLTAVQEDSEPPSDCEQDSMAVQVLSVGMENGQYRTVTLSSGITTTLEDYESEYVQFGIGEALLLPSGVLDETGTDMEALVGLPADQQASPTLLPIPSPEPSPTLPEEDATPGEEGAEGFLQSLQSEGEGDYAAVSVDDIIVCSLPSREDFDWVMERILRGCGTSESAAVTSRGTKESVRLYYLEEAPANLVTRQECYLMLYDRLTLVWTEKVTEEETVRPSKLYLDDESLEKGKTKVDTEGTPGRIRSTYAVTYENGKETVRELTAQKTLAEAKPTIVLRGVKETVKATARPSATSSPATTAALASGTGGYWPGTTIGKGIDYPNIDTSLERPGPDQGIMGPEPGGLTFRYPTDRTHISSNFGWRYGRMHYGVDIFDDRNSPIYASESGTVTSYTGTHSGYGLIVEISHGNGFITRYAHCEKLLVKEGQKVSQGEVIALMGDSGTVSSEPHCHFEIRCDGVPYNPRFYLNK